MRISPSVRCAMGVVAVVAIFSACSSRGSAPFAPVGTNGTAASSEAMLVHAPARFITHPDRRKSWIMPGAATGALLYISDFGTNDVYVYSWPRLKLVGTLTGFSTPQGECVDKAGNIWIANTQAFQIVEYAHGGTNPIKTLNDPGQYPVACSVDPINGDLAVSNIITTGSGPGSIGIYKGATGNPTIYSDPAVARVFFLAYDSHENLFFDGMGGNSAFRMAKFKRKIFTAITISGATIHFPGGVFTKGLKLSVGDQNGANGYSVIYQITDTGTVTGATPLMKTHDCLQYFVNGQKPTQKVICPNPASSSVDIYDYPAGGKPVKIIPAGLSEPAGSAVSP